jgi:hypothetical protein
VQQHLLAHCLGAMVDHSALAAARDQGMTVGRCMQQLLLKQIAWKHILRCLLQQQQWQ